jgi:phosphate starvation-inducible PhoH-like protein
MSEKIIVLEKVDPVDLYGVNNSKFERLKDYFPKVKLIARGHEMKVVGEDAEISVFENKFEQLTDHYHRHHSLTKEDMEKILADVARGATNGNSSNGSGTDDDGNTEGILVYGNTGKAVRPMTVHQFELVDKFKHNDLVFAIGPAGSGKTYIAIALAVRALRNKEVRRILLCRPAVEAGENLGFLPGDLKDKLDPYLQALYDALRDMLPPKKLAEFMEDGTIQIAPLAYMRGRTLDNAFVILDEGQNATSSQIKMFLTRMGRNAKFLVTGDLTQIDLPNKSQSGLAESVRILRNIEGIGVVEFTNVDIVRHRLVRDIVVAYDKLNELKLKAKEVLTKKDDLGLGSS